MKLSKLSTNLSMVLLSASLAVTGCKKTDNAPAPESAATTKPADPAMPKPAEPGAAAAAAPSAPAASGGVTIASDDDYVKGGTAMMDKMIGIFKAAGANCDKLADDITKTGADSAAMIKALDAYEKAHPDVRKKLDEAGKDQMKAFQDAAGPAMGACKDSTKLRDAMAKLSQG